MCLLKKSLIRNVWNYGYSMKKLLWGFLTFFGFLDQLTTCVQCRSQTFWTPLYVLGKDLFLTSDIYFHLVDNFSVTLYATPKGVKLSFLKTGYLRYFVISNTETNNFIFIDWPFKSGNSQTVVIICLLSSKGKGFYL